MSRFSEIKDVLALDVDKVVPILVKKRTEEGADAAELEWPCGLTVRVTRWMAQVIVDNAPHDIRELLYETDFSFYCRETV